VTCHQGLHCSHSCCSWAGDMSPRPALQSQLLQLRRWHVIKACTVHDRLQVSGSLAMSAAQSPLAVDCTCDMGLRTAACNSVATPDTHTHAIIVIISWSSLTISDIMQLNLHQQKRLNHTQIASLTEWTALQHFMCQNTHVLFSQQA